MRVFRPIVAEGFEWVQPVEQADFDAVYQLDGRERGSAWEPVRVRLLQADEKGNPWIRSDLPWLGGHALVLREGALQSVKGALDRFGEFLELELVDGSERLWLFNVCTVVDGLDEAASNVDRFPSTGRVMKITQHAFLPDPIDGKHAFRLREIRSLFVTTEVVAAIEEANLVGAEFELVWEADVSVRDRNHA